MLGLSSNMQFLPRLLATTLLALSIAMPPFPRAHAQALAHDFTLVGQEYFIDMMTFNMLYGFPPHRYTYQDARGDIWHASFLDRQTLQIDRIPADRTPPCQWSYQVEFLSKDRVPKIVIHSNTIGDCPADFALVNLMPSDTLYFNSQASTITIKGAVFIRKSNNHYGNWYYAGKKLEPRDKKHFKKLFRVYKETKNKLRREGKSYYVATHTTLFFSFCDPKYF